MKIAVFGGSYNPIHNAHIQLANYVQKKLGYDKIIFVPSGSSPHKIAETKTSGSHRLKMVQLAIQDNPHFAAEDCELQREGFSYTYDTICYIEEKYKNQLNNKIGLILGQDLFSGFHLWHKAEDLSKKCTLILAIRPEEKKETLTTNEALGEYKNVQNQNDFLIKDEPLFKDAILLENPLMQISSSQIRQLVKQNENFEALVDPKVFEYIKKNNLYKEEQK